MAWTTVVVASADLAPLRILDAVGQVEADADQHL
jgi:hypothetical protein